MAIRHNMIVRWMGAFRKGAGSLHEALGAELSGVLPEVAAERISFCDDSYDFGAVNAGIGLVIAKSAVIKEFKGDVWSERHPAGILEATRKPARTAHNELFCRPDYRAIIVRDWGYLPRKTRSTVAYYARRYHLPIVQVVYDRDGIWTGTKEVRL